MACFANDLPAYTNAHLQESQSSGMDDYNPGEEVVYECNDGFYFDPSIPFLGCFCYDNFDGAGTWICAAHQGATTAACIPSKLFLCRAVLLTQWLP